MYAMVNCQLCTCKIETNGEEKQTLTYTHSAGQFPSHSDDKRRRSSTVLKGNSPSKLQRRHRIGPSMKLALSQN